MLGKKWKLVQPPSTSPTVRMSIETPDAAVV